MDQKNKTWKEKLDDWGYEHLTAKRILEYVLLFFISTLSAFLFSFGFKAAAAPETVYVKQYLGEAFACESFVTGGVSGIAQNIDDFITLLFYNFHKAEYGSYEAASFAISGFIRYFYSGLYLLINIPILILCWKGVGKRFTIFTLINVIEVSIFTSFLGRLEFVVKVYGFIASNGGLFSRAFIAGAFTGLAAVLPIRFDFTDGGVDCLSYYISLRKKGSVGKIGLAINTVTVIFYFILSCLKSGSDIEAIVNNFGLVIFSFIFMLTATIVIDAINVRNKKVELKIITSDTELVKYLILNLAHGATVLEAKGGFKGEKKQIIVMVVSIEEVAPTAKLVMQSDPTAFIETIPLSQVYGRFFSRPIK